MTRKNLLPFSRRGFIKLIGSISVLLMFSNPFQLYAGSPSTLIDFAQVTDVHIVDNGNKLRFEEVINAGILDDLGIIPPELPSPISHETDDRTAYNWDRVIRSINAEHRKAALDFVISTGDHTDTNLENELKWFIEIANGGPLSADYYDRTGKKDVYNLTDIAGFDKNLPWYAALGNHDAEYQGSINNLSVVDFLNKVIDRIRLTYPDDIKDLCSQKEALSMYLNAGGNPKGHGFANMPEPIFPFTIKEGYYSFDPTPFIHCIVLNTANYRPEIMLGKIGYREFLMEGFLNGRQLIWMKQDIERNAKKLIIVFSHHPQPKIISATKDQLEKTLSSYPNVIAHIAGHKHDNLIKEIKKSDGKPAYCRIRTNAAMRSPHEWRQFTVTDNGNGTGTINTVIKAVETAPQESEEFTFVIPAKVQNYMNTVRAQGKQTTKEKITNFFKSIFGRKK